MAAGAMALPAQAAGQSRELVDLGPGAWSWFADPRAVHFGGLTYVGWVDRSGRVTVTSYNRRGIQQRAIVKHFNVVDDHDNPALLFLPSGRLAVFYSHHFGRTMAYRVTQRPADLSSFGPPIRIPTNSRGRGGYTYPNPIRLRGEGDRIYLFWRGGNRNPTFSTNSPNRGWTRARTLVYVRGQRPYAKYASDGNRTIAAAFTNGHPRETATSLYFVKIRGGAVRGPSGKRISSLRGLPIRRGQASLVHSFRRTRLRAWVHDVALTRSGRPVVVYAAFRRNGANDHLYYYAVWTGRRWAKHLMTHAGGPITSDRYENLYSGGLTLKHGDPRTVYLSRQIGRYHQVEKWLTRNGGRSWARRRITRSPTGNVRPIAPRGLPRGQEEIIWMHGRYNLYRAFRTSIFSEIGR